MNALASTVVKVVLGLSTVTGGKAFAAGTCGNDPLLPVQCSSLSQTDCGRRYGCYWSADQNRCGGDTVACSSFVWPTTCEQQPGCHFTWTSRDRYVAGDINFSYEGNSNWRETSPGVNRVWRELHRTDVVVSIYDQSRNLYFDIYDNHCYFRFGNGAWALWNQSGQWD